MPSNPRLSKQMTVDVFENNYWYAVELKAFAKEIGIPRSHRLRKDQLESAIKRYLSDGKLVEKPVKISRKRIAPKDYEMSPLTSNTRIINYTSNKVTKAFIQTEARKRQPGVPKKSGAWYWLNRWREDQIEKRLKITYGDLVEYFLILSNTQERLPRIPSTKFNNFISDFLSAKAGSRSDATAAWETLKKWDCPKTFEAWREHNN